MSATPVLCIATPAYAGLVGIDCMMSVMDLYPALNELGIRLRFVHTADSLISRGRDKLAHAFLKSDATHLFFIDADIDFKAECVLEMLAAMENAALDIVAGAYPKKRTYWQLAAKALENGTDPERMSTGLVINMPNQSHDVVEGCIEVQAAGTGFMLIRRAVFERMAEEQAAPLYVCDAEADRNGGEPMFGFFTGDGAIVNGRLLSEDYLFCHRWRAMGGKVHVFLNADLGHTGMTRFAGCLAERVASNMERPKHEAIPGWFDFGDIYAQAVDEAQDGAKFVEVGTAFGRSAAFMAEQIKASGKRVDFACIDPWIDDDTVWGADYAAHGRSLGGPYSAFVTHMRKAGLLEQVRPLRMKSVDAAKAFEDASLDFVFIDGDHAYESVVADIAAWRPKVKPGGVIAGHDHSPMFPGVVQAVGEAFGMDRTIRGGSWWVRL